MPTPTLDASRHFVLLQMRVAPSVASDASRIGDDVRAFNAAPLVLHRAACSLDGTQACVYLKPDAAAPPEPPDEAALASAFAAQCGWASEVRASRLQPMLAIEGASASDRPEFHYVVETDPESGWLDEISRWYDTEHMPGLAAVPGCVRAMRFLNRGAGPLSLACYDIVREDVLGSPPWLAVRATAWSDIARPHFTNTKRTMFRVVA
jgi:hypothetical protein